VEIRIKNPMLKFQQPGIYTSVNTYKLFCILFSFKNWSAQHIQENMVGMLHLQKKKHKKKKEEKKCYNLQVTPKLNI
jgi:hypothetical protein